MNVTLDGFFAGPHCELDWHFRYWNNEMADCAGEQLSRADTLLLGRITYGAMARHWSSVAMDPSFPREDMAFADMMNKYTKVVFSRTLKDVGIWQNTRLAEGTVGNAVRQLKREKGKDIIVYGSGSIVSALMQHNLVDEYVLWVHPVFLGKGKPLFKGHQQSMQLVRTQRFGSGVVLLSYGK